jgi:hypothetical protein
MYSTRAVPFFELLIYGGRRARRHHFVLLSAKCEKLRGKRKRGFNLALVLLR